MQTNSSLIAETVLEFDLYRVAPMCKILNKLEPAKLLSRMRIPPTEHVWAAAESLCLRTAMNAIRRRCAVSAILTPSTSRDLLNYFNHTAGRIWNALPCDEVDFSQLRRFCNSLTAKVLVLYCSLNFI